MSAQVINLDGQNRAIAHETRDEAELAGFRKGLAAVYSLHGSNLEESKAAIENWFAGELLSQGERAALYKYFGLERNA